MDCKEVTNMKYIYSATFVPDEEGSKYYCGVSDLPGCITTGDSIDDYRCRKRVTRGWTMQQLLFPLLLL